MITDEFRARVRNLRDQGKSWPQVSRLTGRPQRTCQRALEVPVRVCSHHGCNQPTEAVNGKLCPEHRKRAMRNKPGQGPEQQRVMRIMRKLGHASSEELREFTGLDSSSLGQIMTRLVRLGMIERPMKGHYVMPRPPEMTPAHPIANTPDRY